MRTNTQTVHNNFCNCFECQSPDTLLTERYAPSNHADPVSTPATGTPLVFAPMGKTVNVYKGGTVSRTVSNGNLIGIVKTYYTASNGLKMDILDTGESVFEEDLKGTPVSLDKAYATAKATETANTNVLPDGSQDTIYSVGGLKDQAMNFVSDFKWYLIAIAVVVLVAIFLRVRG